MAKIRAASLINRPSRVMVDVINKTTGEKFLYDSARIAAKALGVSVPTITAKLNGDSAALVLGIYEIKAAKDQVLSLASFLHSDETRAGMSESQKERFSSSEARDLLMKSAINRIEIEITDLKDDTTTKFHSIRQASRELGLHPASISKV